MRGALVVTTVLASVVGSAAPASAVSEEMKPGEVRVIDGFVPSAPLLKPDDPRIRGYGFSAAIEGISEAVMVEDGIFDFKPPPGHRIVVFGVRFDRHGGTDHSRPVRATVVADGRRTAVDFSFGGGEGPLVAVAVATDAGQVQFEMAAAGLAQTFSLTDRKRVGPQPGVLYRDANGPEVVTDVNADRVVRAEDGTAASSLTLTLRRARLSWFSPGPVTGADDAEVVTPSSPDRAFLVVEAEADERDSTFEDFGTVPAGDVKVRLSDGTVVDGRHAGPSDGLVSGSYWFEVPADTTTATVMVGPATVPAKRRGGAVIEPTNVRIEQAAFDLTFPAGTMPAPSEPSSTTSTPTTAGSLGRTEPTSEEGDGGGFPVWVLALALAVGLAGLVAWRVRRPGEDGAPSPADDGHQPLGEPVSLLALTETPVLEVGGEGALDAVRAAVEDVDAGAVVVLARDETERLWPGPDDPPSTVAMVRDAEAVLPAVEVARLRLARLADELGDGDAEDVEGEARPVVVVVPASLDGEVGRALREAAQAHPGTRLVVVGAGPLEVDAAGVVTEGDGATRRVVVVGEPPGEVPPDAPSDAEPQPAVAQRPPVAVSLFGPYGITAGDRQIGTGLRGKSRELLALLAVHREGITADAAMEALWPGEPPDDGYLRTVVGNLRTVLRSAAGAPGSAPVVERIGQHLRLDPAFVDVDLWRFEDALAAAANGDDAAAELAVAAYRGDLLDGADFPWADPARARLRGRALDLLADLAERRRERGDMAGALRVAERAVELDPYAEALYQRVMALYRDLGRPDGARRTFETLEARMRELDAAPSDASRALVDDLRG
jgi:DNA-binding SARP family transcriptional activator